MYIKYAVGSGEISWNPKTAWAELDLDSFYIK